MNKIMGGREKVRVSVCQAPPVYMDKVASIEKACECVQQCAANGAELIAFPEGWLAGYPLWSTGWDYKYAEYAQYREIFFNNSMTIEDPALIPLCNAAKQANAYVVVGFNERDARPGVGTIYNAFLFIGRDGKIMGTHRKLMPCFTEQAFWGRGDSRDLTVFETDIGRISGLICAEHWMPSVKAAIAVQGVDFHIAGWSAAFGYQGPGVNESEEPQGTGPIHVSGRQFALDATCYVLNVAGKYDINSINPAFPNKEKLHWFPKGGSSIIAPSGMVLAGPIYEEDFLYYDCTATNIIAQKGIVDGPGYNSRSDVVQIVVNRSHTENILFCSGKSMLEDDRDISNAIGPTQEGTAVDEEANS